MTRARLAQPLRRKAPRFPSPQSEAARRPSPAWPRRNNTSQRFPTCFPSARSQSRPGSPGKTTPSCPRPHSWSRPLATSPRAAREPADRPGRQDEEPPHRQSQRASPWWAPCTPRYPHAPSGSPWRCACRVPCPPRPCPPRDLARACCHARPPLGHD